MSAIPRRVGIDARNRLMRGLSGSGSEEGDRMRRATEHESEIDRCGNGIGVGSRSHVLPRRNPSVDRQIEAQHQHAGRIVRRSASIVAPDQRSGRIEVQVVVERRASLQHESRVVCWRVPLAQVHRDQEPGQSARDVQKAGGIDRARAQDIVGSKGDSARRGDRAAAQAGCRSRPNQSDTDHNRAQCAELGRSHARLIVRLPARNGERRGRETVDSRRERRP